MKIGILALQGAFIEHRNILKSMNLDINMDADPDKDIEINTDTDIEIESFEIRQQKDLLENEIDGLILPGGESTVQGKLLKELGLLDPIKNLIENNLPVLGTCAGLILLAEKISGQEENHIATMPVKVKRNAYGRQLGSFYTIGEFKDKKIPMTFIRAPYVEERAQGVEVLSVVQEKIVAVKYKNQIAIAFHPELDKDTTIHKYFIEMVKENINKKYE